MPNSPRIHFPYPDETSRPWDASFAAMVNALDAALYANREDRNFAMAGGGRHGLYRQYGTAHVGRPTLRSSPPVYGVF
jgi:hypothetical protein